MERRPPRCCTFLLFPSLNGSEWKCAGPSGPGDVADNCPVSSAAYLRDQRETFLNGLPSPYVFHLCLDLHCFVAYAVSSIAVISLEAKGSLA